MSDHIFVFSDQTSDFKLALSGTQVLSKDVYLPPYNVLKETGGSHAISCLHVPVQYQRAKALHLGLIPQG